MDLLRVFQRFPDHEACIEHLERVRWSDTPTCPHCQSPRVGRKADGERIGRWNCHACHASFNVLASTILQKTRVPAPEVVSGHLPDAERQEGCVEPSAPRASWI